MSRCDTLIGSEQVGGRFSCETKLDPRGWRLNINNTEVADKGIVTD